MLNLSNGLSFLRAPLALLFLVDAPSWRIGAIILAMITDSIDGYLARKNRSTSQFGAILDPAMDKFFVFFALGVFLMEKKLLLWQACAMIARDLFLCIFGIYLSIQRLWNAYAYRSIRWGKISTAFQFVILIGLSLGLSFPSYLFIGFILFGAFAFIELWTMRKKSSAPSGQTAESYTQSDK